MFDNIQCMGDDWVCFLDEPYNGNHVAYAGSGIESVCGADEYWSQVMARYTQSKQPPKVYDFGNNRQSALAFAYAEVQQGNNAIFVAKAGSYEVKVYD